MYKILLRVCLAIDFISVVIIGYSIYQINTLKPSPLETSPPGSIIEKIIPTITPQVSYNTPPSTHILPLRTHVFQTFNNCGPASLSMLFSYFDLNITQKVLGDKLRPYQNQKGDNDDKNVFVTELEEEALSRGFSAYHRPNGSVELLKTLIANDIPVLTRTWLDEKEDIGHYRVVRGYDDQKKVFIQDDSLQGKNLEFDYDTFFGLWEPYHFEYLVVAPKEKDSILRAIIGEDTDEKKAWEAVYAKARVDLERDPSSVSANWTLSVSSYHLGKYQESVEFFEKIRSSLPPRTLWYQIEPVEAYLKLKMYGKLFEVTDSIFNSQNRAFSELYVLRAQAYIEQERDDLARNELEKALLYNKNLKSAQDLLSNL